MCGRLGEVFFFFLRHRFISGPGYKMEREVCLLNCLGVSEVGHLEDSEEQNLLAR